jgi:NADPH-dependent ferric siderophore reductase
VPPGLTETEAGTETVTVVPWRAFPVRVRALTRLSPSFLRVTFAGDELEHFADNGWDQRIKLVFPTGGAPVPDFPDADWYGWWRALPDERRNPIRTYTARAVRRDAREVDVDIALHGDGGPAARWAGAARPGDAIAVVGPDARYPGDHGGVEFRPAAGTGALLIAGDETAAPAICAILSQLPPHARGQVLVEVPHRADALPVVAPAGVRVTWLARAGGAHGSVLEPAVREAAITLLAGSVHEGPELGEPDDEVLWEVPDEPAPAGAYAWLAGEAGVITALRRHLVRDLGWERRSVAFMGYWKIGRAED